MLNLRQLNKPGHSQSNSEDQHLSRFSISFCIPSSLGNIGEPLDHGQSQRYIYEDDEQPINAERGEGANHSATTDQGYPVAGPSDARWDDENRNIGSRLRGSSSGNVA